ncbi:hypothetical protein SFC23_05825 [Shouchella clausii]|uniref:hypothetical protein n=1 Tax=Shouchella clausii TaxID=79880 RepID=UPI0039833910
MKRKRMFVIAVVLVLCVGIAFYFWYKDQQEKEANANYALLEEYNYAGGTLHMEADTSEYDQTGDPNDIELMPTDLTYELLQRWEAIAELIPTIDYPEDAVEEGDWLKVYNTLANNRFDMEEASEKLAEGATNETPESMVINSYIYKGMIRRNYFREFLEENGIEGPDRRRPE